MAKSDPPNNKTNDNKITIVHKVKPKWRTSLYLINQVNPLSSLNHYTHFNNILFLSLPSKVD